MHLNLTTEELGVFKRVIEKANQLEASRAKPRVIALMSHHQHLVSATFYSITGAYNITSVADANLCPYDTSRVFRFINPMVKSSKAIFNEKTVEVEIKPTPVKVKKGDTTLSEPLEYSYDMIEYFNSYMQVKNKLKDIRNGNRTPVKQLRKELASIFPFIVEQEDRVLDTIYANVQLFPCQIAKNEDAMSIYMTARQHNQQFIFEDSKPTNEEGKNRPHYERMRVAFSDANWCGFWPLPWLPTDHVLKLYSKVGRLHISQYIAALQR